MRTARKRPPDALGARRARNQAERIGAEIKAARAENGMTRASLSRRAQVSPDTIRRVENGDPSVQLDTLCAVGAAVGLDVVVQAYRSRPLSLRDTGQLELAQQLCAQAATAWRWSLEVPAGDRGEAADLLFFGADVILHCEIERLLTDFQDQHRRHTRKRDWLAARHQRPVRAVMVVEDTERNRRVFAPHGEIIKSVLPAGSREILRSLRAGQPLGRDGLLWIRRSPTPSGTR